MKTHIQSVHEMIKYSCDQCEYQFTRQSNLKRHILSVHEKVRYPCDQCEHQATTQGSLKRHIQCVHQEYIPVVEASDDQPGSVSKVLLTILELRVTDVDGTV